MNDSMVCKRVYSADGIKLKARHINMSTRAIIKISADGVKLKARHITVNTQCLCCEGKSHHLPIGEFGYDTVSRNNSRLIYLISCKFLADFKNFTELCDEVVHIYDNST